MTAKKPRLSITTPPGLAVWPFLNNPQMTHAKTNTDGVFKVDLAYDKDDPNLIAFRTKLEEFAVECREGDWGQEEVKPAWATGIPISDEVEEDDDGNDIPTGRVLVRCKLKQYRSGGKGKGLIEQRVTFYDGRAQLIPPAHEPRVGGGSVLCVSCDATPWAFKKDKTMYITLYIAGVQIRKLVEFGTKDVQRDYGMECDDDAYLFALTGAGSADDEAEEYEDPEDE